MIGILVLIGLVVLAYMTLLWSRKKPNSSQNLDYQNITADKTIYRPSSKPISKFRTSGQDIIRENEFRRLYNINNKKSIRPKIYVRLPEHRNPSARNKMINWARDILEDKDQYVILDTETSGLGSRAVMLQVGILNLDGEVLMNSLIKPPASVRISKEASAIHGITKEDLVDAPELKDIIAQVFNIFENKKVLIYNEEFDNRILMQSCERSDLKFYWFESIDVMKPYSEFYGLWSDYWYDYSWRKLPASKHSAIEDCQATLNVLKFMAYTPMDLQA